MELENAMRERCREIGKWHSLFSLIVSPFSKNLVGEASDVMLEGMTKFFTPAVRAASRTRVVSETASRMAMGR